MTALFKKAYLKELKVCLETEPRQGPIGRSAHSWMKIVTAKDLKHLPKELIDRKHVKAFCSSQANNDIEDCCAVIFSWGGMRPKNGKFFFDNEHFEEIKVALNNLRTSQNSRQEDFEILQKLNIKGVGIAFFSKLLFFLRPKSDAYILDQWTALSMNLLLDDPEFIRLNCSVNRYKREERTVSAINNHATYEKFCSYIDFLGTELSITGKRAEELIFSRGARGRQPAWRWRKYAKENYKLMTNRNI